MGSFGAAPAGATTYYVDALKGSDANAGTSVEAAWASVGKVSGHTFQPGDSVLFHAGQRFVGEVDFRGSGTKEAPIVAGAYGDGAKPEIAGEGAVVAVKLDDVSFWTVRGLRVSNHGKTVEVRNGVEVHASYKDSVSVHLMEVDVVDVNGEVHSKSSGGIGILGWGKNGRRPRFDDLVIERCTIRHADGQGIWVHEKGKDDGEGDDSGVTGEYPITHFRLAYTTIEDTGRNALFLRDAEGAVVEHNTVLHSSARTHGNAVVIAWSKNTVVRENEVAFTGEGQGSGENGGFDADDGAVNTLFEYNWTHDNAGGSINVVVDPGKHVPNDSTMIRYNVSENDGARVFGVDGTVTNVAIVNNTIFVGKKGSEKVLSLGRFTAKKPGNPDRVAFMNNVMYVEGDATYSLEGAHVGLDGNCFVGKKPGGEFKSDAGKVWEAAGWFAAGTGAVSGWAGLERYRPEARSECAAGGRELRGNGGRDVLGTAVVVSGGKGALVGR